MFGVVTPKDEDDFNAFDGQCIRVRNGFLQVRDMDDDVFEVEVSQFTPYPLETPQDPYSHLTTAQKARILEVAIEARIEACLENRDYLRNTVRDLAVRDDIISLLESISSGTKERIALLGFNPETGQKTEV